MLKRDWQRYAFSSKGAGCPGKVPLNRLRVLAGMCWSVPGRTAKSCLPARDPKMFSFVLFVKQQEGKVATPTAMVYGVGVVFGYVMCEADNL